MNFCKIYFAHTARRIGQIAYQKLKFLFHYIWRLLRKQVIKHSLKDCSPQQKHKQVAVEGSSNQYQLLVRTAMRKKMIKMKSESKTSRLAMT